MKKIITLLTIFVAVIAVAGCALLQDEDPRDTVFETREEIIGFSALSSVLTLHNRTTDTTLHQNRVVNLSNNDFEDTLAVLEEIEELAPYLDLVNTFMGNGGNFEVAVTESQHEDYDHSMVITTINMKGEPVDFVLHYNETFEVDEDEEFDPEEFDSVIEGIMIIEGVTYTLYGEREVDEGEEELELIAKLDDENYVTLDYEIEDEDGEYESEFVYELYVDGELVKMIEIDFEQDEEEIEMELKFISGNRESEYDFEIEIDGDTRTIEIEYKISVDGNVIEEGEIEVKIVIDAQTGETVIRYEIESSGKKVVVDDDYDFPGDDEDDEDDDDEDDEDDVDDEDDEDDEDSNVASIL